MKRDILLGVLTVLASGLLAWFFAGSPSRPTRLHQKVELVDDADMKRVSEQSPYMRNER